MKKVSIQELKAQLSAAVAEAESGETIVITRHGRSVAQLVRVRSPHTHVGKTAPSVRLEPLLRQATRGRYLTVLLEDRRGADPE